MTARSCLAGLALLSFLTASAFAQEPETEPAVEPEVRALLERMAGTLAGAKRLSFVAQVEVDVLQDSGELLEFGATRRVTLRRPDRLRVDVERRDGTRGGLRFDGERVVLFDEIEKVYAAAAAGPGLDAAFDFAEGALQTPIPLADLLRSDLRETVGQRVDVGRLAGEDLLDGVRCAHLALRNEAVDVQLWVERETHLPRRVAITYRDDEGHPQFRAWLRDWNLSPEVPDDAFAFGADGFERVPFALRQRAGAEGVAQ